MSKKQNSDSVLSTQRLEAFSDSVFAIVMTLLFLELRVPPIGNPENWRELLTATWNLMPKFMSICVSFSFVAIFWVAHHQFFHTLHETTRGLLWLNVVFLFMVCFVPFPAAVMSEYPNNQTSVVFFGVAVLMTSILLVALRWYAWFKHRELSSTRYKEQTSKALRRGILMTAVYLGGIVVSFFYPTAAIVIYLLTPLTLLFPVKVDVETEDEEGNEETNEVVL